MHRMAAVALLLSTWPVLEAQQNSAWILKNIQDTRDSSQAPAQAALLAFKRMALDERRPNRLGFEKDDSVSAAVLGQPLVVFGIPMKALLAFGAADQANNAYNLLAPPQSVILPAYSGEHLRSTITLKKDRVWEPSAFGAPRLAAELAAVLQAQQNKAGCSGYFAVAPPLRELLFLAVACDAARDFLLIPIRDDQLLEIKAGGSYSAAEIFKKLASIARRPGRGPG